MLKLIYIYHFDPYSMPENIKKKQNIKMYNKLKNPNCVVYVFYKCMYVI